MINNGITQNNVGQYAPCQLSCWKCRSYAALRWWSQRQHCQWNFPSRLFLFSKMPTCLAQRPRMLVCLMTQAESKDLGESRQWVSQKLVEARQTLKGSPLFVLGHFKWPEMGLLPLLVSIHQEKAWCSWSCPALYLSYDAMWPCELKGSFSVGLSSWSSHHPSDLALHHLLFFSAILASVNLQTHQLALAPGSLLLLSLCYLWLKCSSPRYL